jgi:hypothetical protein
LVIVGHVESSVIFWYSQMLVTFTYYYDLH